MEQRTKRIAFYAIKYLLVVFFFAVISLSMSHNFTGRGNWLTFLLAGVICFALSFVEIALLQWIPGLGRWSALVYLGVLTLNFSVLFLLISYFIFVGLVIAMALFLLYLFLNLRIPVVNVKTTYRDAQGREQVQYQQVIDDDPAMAKYRVQKELQDHGAKVISQEADRD